jgi:hypothetical protein
MGKRDNILNVFYIPCGCSVIGLYVHLCLFTFNSSNQAIGLVLSLLHERRRKTLHEMCNSITWRKQNSKRTIFTHFYYILPKPETKKNTNEQRSFFSTNRWSAWAQRVGLWRHGLSHPFSSPSLDVTTAIHPSVGPPSWMIYGVGLEGRPSSHHSKLGWLADRPFACRAGPAQTTNDHNPEQ